MGLQPDFSFSLQPVTWRGSSSPEKLWEEEMPCPEWLEERVCDNVGEPRYVLYGDLSRRGPLARRVASSSWPWTCFSFRERCHVAASSTQALATRALRGEAPGLWLDLGHFLKAPPAEHRGNGGGGPGVLLQKFFSSHESTRHGVASPRAWKREAGTPLSARGPLPFRFPPS